MRKVPRPESWLVVLGVTVATLAVAALPTPAGLPVAGQRALATATFAAGLWITGAFPLAVTALTVPFWLVVLGVYPTLSQALTGFADPIVFLFLSTFVLAAALQKHGLDRRVALRLLGRVGTTPRRVVLGVMVATAVLSMLISNTATVALMAPIAVGVVRQIDAAADRSVENLHAATLLGVAYAGSIGGIGTLIGTPPNAIVVAQLADAGYEVSFADWLAVGLPTVAATLPLAWYLLVRLYPPEPVDVSGARASARRSSAASGPLDRPARRVAVVFVAVAILWLLGGLEFVFAELLPPEWQTTLFGGEGAWVLGEGVAAGGEPGYQGLLYFVVVGLAAIPVLFLAEGVEWEDVEGIDWGTLLLFGGGLTLADALSDTGATEWLAGRVLVALGDAPLAVLLVALVALTVALSELASNTATAAVLAPVLIEVGREFGTVGGGGGSGGGGFIGIGGAGVEAAVLLPVASAVAASYGFALPVATPPNAIVFGTGEVTRGQMLRAGSVLDAVFVIVTTGILLVLAVTILPAVV
ncbi:MULTISPECIES: DASS family sodium-coupled anion symporter [Halorussus]|uniref:SLC13 family permease n=1 Tax=Halorussus TaxID=1070314 RepID=UPI000E20F393|nr:MULTISPECIES: DASS family sodium-coupled anion symporter [Halorussus]NHN61241.1 DASS family sodium-coupled anion symporter [Halorussus sp. JP-T4]